MVVFGFWLVIFEWVLQGVSGFADCLFDVCVWLVCVWCVVCYYCGVIGLGFVELVLL